MCIMRANGFDVTKNLLNNLNIIAKRYKISGGMTMKQLTRVLALVLALGILTLAVGAGAEGA